MPPFINITTGCLWAYHYLLALPPPTQGWHYWIENKRLKSEKRISNQHVVQPHHKQKMQKIQRLCSCHILKIVISKIKIRIIDLLGYHPEGYLLRYSFKGSFSGHTSTVSIKASLKRKRGVTMSSHTHTLVSNLWLEKGIPWWKLSCSQGKVCRHLLQPDLQKWNASMPIWENHRKGRGSATVFVKGAGRSVMSWAHLFDLYNWLMITNSSLFCIKGKFSPDR